MSLAYVDGLNYTCVGTILDTKNKPLFKYAGNCYSGMLRNIPDEVRKTMKWFDFNWVDRVSEHYKNTTVANKAIAYLKDTRVMRNAKFIRTKRDRLHNIDTHFNGYNYYFRLRLNVKKIKPDEAFLVGCIFRTFTTSPAVIDNFVKLCDLHGHEIDKSLLFMMAYKVTFGSARSIYSSRGHSVVDAYFGKLSGVTFEQFLKLTEGQPSFNKATSYGYVQLNPTFVASTKDSYGRDRPSFDSKIIKYKSEVIQSLIQVEEIV